MYICVHMHLYIHTSESILIMYIDNHEFTLIPPFPIEHQRVYPSSELSLSVPPTSDSEASGLFPQAESPSALLDFSPHPARALSPSPGPHRTLLSAGPLIPLAGQPLSADALLTHPGPDTPPGPASL